MLKKLLFSFLLVNFLFISLAVFFTPQAKAQAWYLQDYNDWYERVYNPDNPEEIFGERYTAAQIEWVIYGLIAFVYNHLVGPTTITYCILTHPGNLAPCASLIAEVLLKWLSYNDMSSIQNLAQSGNPIINIISGKQQLSGFGYVRDKLSNIHLVQEAKAQIGVGFNAASGIGVLWTAIRNLTYFLLILAMVVMSFMIMFRVKLSPQTVISVQSAIPRLIIALILITFSYAIAGFMIDLMYVLIGLIAAILQQSELFSETWQGMYAALSGGFPFGVFGLMVVYLLLFGAAGSAAFQDLLTVMEQIFGGGFVMSFIWLIIYIIAIIALLIVFIKIMWTLIKSFVSLLLLIAAGPLYILGGAIGMGGIAGWLKAMLSNLIIYPTVGTMFAISFLFLASAIPDGLLTDEVVGLIPFLPIRDALGAGGGGWAPPYVVISSNLRLIWLFASFVIITLIPNIAAIIKGAVSGRPFAVGSAIGSALGAGVGVAGYPIREAYGTVSEATRKGFQQPISDMVQRARQRLSGR